MPKGQYERDHGRKWTDDDILDTLHMRDEGFTMREIGNRFGVTRNAVIGMVYRVMNESR